MLSAKAFSMAWSTPLSTSATVSRSSTFWRLTSQLAIVLSASFTPSNAEAVLTIGGTPPPPREGALTAETSDRSESKRFLLAIVSHYAWRLFFKLSIDTEPSLFVVRALLLHQLIHFTAEQIAAITANVSVFV